MSELVEAAATETSADGVETGEKEVGGHDDQSSKSASSGSDDSSSSSSDESANSRSSGTSSRTNGDKSHQSDRSDTMESVSDHDRQSNDSFKSLNTTAKIDEVVIDLASKDAPRLPQQPELSDQGGVALANPQVDLFLSPKAALVKKADLASTSSTAASPIPVTPAKSVKSLEWDELVASMALPQKTLTTEPPVTPDSLNQPKSSPGHLMSPPLIPPIVVKTVTSKSGKPIAGKVVAPAGKGTVVPAPPVVSDDGALKPGDTSLSETPGSRHKRSRLEKALEKKDQAVKKVEEDVRRLELELKDIRLLKDKAKIDAKKRRLAAKKHKRAKKRKVRSGDEQESSGSSSANEQPTTSYCIKKIPDGRKYQRIAMSRAKQFGVITIINTEPAELTNAIKLVDSTEFKFLPSHAFEHFLRVPGTGLPHIRKLVKDVQARYAPILQATARLHLGLARNTIQSKQTLVASDEGNPFVPIWCFKNDLVRASDKPDVELGQLDALEADVNVESAPSTSKAIETPKVEVIAVEKAPVVQNQVVTEGEKPAKKDKDKKKKDKSHKHKSR